MIYPQTMHAMHCTDNCGGLRIEPVPIEKHVDLAFPIFEHIFFFMHFLQGSCYYPC